MENKKDVLQCENVLCVHYCDGYCILPEVTLDHIGLCKNCILVEISGEHLNMCRRYYQQSHGQDKPE